MPRVDPLTVLVIVLVLLSLMQYAIRKSMYEKALYYASNTEKFRRMVNEAYND